MTLAEMLVAATVTLLVAGAALSAVTPVQQGFAAQPEAAGLSQRARVVAELLAADIRQASLVLPYRIGSINDDIATRVFYRDDVVTTVMDPIEALARGVVAPSTSRTYHLARDSEGVWQLMQYDGRESDQPAVEDVVSLAFEYLGEAEAPGAYVDPDGSVRVTYGAAPPPAGIDDPGDTWGAGENCTFTIGSAGHVPRLMVLGAPGLAALTPALLTDGPWCPDDTHAFRFDADLLRVRRVRVRVRLQAARPFRGLAPSWSVPDETVTLEISPRNAHVAR